MSPPFKCTIIHSIHTRGVPIIGSTDISATDRVILTTSVIGTIIIQPADINTDYSACKIYFI